MTNQQMDRLIAKYFIKDGYQFPGDFEHRVDPRSSQIMYSLVRAYKPKIALSFGTWWGGSACLIMSALQTNNVPFEYYTAEILEDQRESTLRNVFNKCGRTPVMLGDITKSLKHLPPKIDFLFHDTDHDKETTDWVFKNIFPRIKERSIVIFHDWAVEELADGTWWGKGEAGVGGWEETNYWMDRQKEGKLGLKKLFWTWKNPGAEELGCFTRI